MELSGQSNDKKPPAPPRCKRCKGRGVLTDLLDATCPDCGGTGDA